MLSAALMNEGLTNKLHDALGWVFPCLALGSAIVCFSTARVSTRMPLLAIGFLLEGIAGFGNRFIVQFMLRKMTVSMDYENIELYFLLLSLLHFIAAILILLGLVLVFADIRRRLARASDRDDYGPSPHSREPEDDRPRRGRQDGGRDIRP